MSYNYLAPIQPRGFTDPGDDDPMMDTPEVMEVLHEMFYEVDTLAAWIEDTAYRVELEGMPLAQMAVGSVQDAETALEEFKKSLQADFIGDDNNLKKAYERYVENY